MVVGIQGRREESKYSARLFGNASFSSTIEMKRSSGCRWWPSSQLEALEAERAADDQEAEKDRAGALAGQSRRGRGLARRDAEALAGEEAADLFAVGRDPVEQPVDALGGRDRGLQPRSFGARSMLQ